ncbi:MAG: hypothetical protein STHCBS139747_007110 [Sporothrix thermara]
MASLSLDEAAQLYSTLHHFFEVAVHAVLYYRRLYPERAFATATAFDVPVHQSRHPAVCAWVRAAVEQVMVQIAGGGQAAAADKPPAEGVNAVAVVVHAPYRDDVSPATSGGGLPPGAVLERWVFDVRHLPRGWPGGIEALRRAQTDRSKRDGRGDGADRGQHDGELDRREAREAREARRSRRRPPEKGAAGAGGEDGGEEDVWGAGGEARYNYYDEEEELANAESEAELDEDDNTSGDGDEHTGGGDRDTSSSFGTVNWTDLDDQLRGVLQRLAQAGQQVAALPDGCTFTVAIELGDGLEGEPGADTARRHMDTNWIPETSGHKQQPFGGETAAVGGSTTSIRSVDSAPLYLECWVEESAVKNAAAKGLTRAQLAATASSESGGILPPLQAAMAMPSTASTASYRDSDTPRPNKGKTVSFT